jgi:hypothetical protein
MRAAVLVGKIWVEAHVSKIWVMKSLPSLSPGKHNIQELLARRHGGNVFPLGLHVCECGLWLRLKQAARCPKKFAIVITPKIFPHLPRTKSSPHQR